MYKYLRAKNFRCFDDLVVEPLQRVNLITGKNNVGKTALLEALWLHHGYHNPELGLRLRMFRGLTHFKRDEFLWDLFSQFDPEKRIELLSQDQDGRERSLHITIHEHPVSRVSLHRERSTEGNGKDALAADMLEQETTTPVATDVRLRYRREGEEHVVEAHAFVESEGIKFERPPAIKEPSAVFLAARQRGDSGVLAERFGNLAVNKATDKVVHTLQIIEPRLESLAVRHMGGSPIIYGDVGTERLIPLPLMGDGIGRLLNMALAIPEAEDGVLLVDEVENGLHYSVMKDVWKAIDKLAREYNVQVFATTHSDECARAAYQAFANDKQYNFALHRLERVNGRIQAVSYDRGMLEAAFEIDAEIR